ncbi:transposase DNA-binding domain protein, partial [Leptotrichia wadei]
SSKTCSKCGNIKEKLKLSERSYKCECCGIEIDRDYNAALNIKNIGKLMLVY